jgi:anti-sigma28 factor (negative regulator of flagellin synthesis)
MSTDKIGRLISALGKSAYEPQAVRRPDAEKQARPQDSDAVKISPGFGRAEAKEGEPVERARKVAALKAQVEEGIYRPKSEDIAAALVREFGL